MKRVREKRRHLEPFDEGGFKVVDADVYGYDIDADMSSGFNYLLNATRAGSDFYERIGCKISLHSLRVRGGIEAKAAVGGFPNVNPSRGVCVRIIVVFVNNNSGLITTINEVVGQVNVTGGFIAWWSSGIRYDAIDRFKILHDEVVVLNPLEQPSGTIDIPIVKQAIDFTVDLRGLETVYNRTGVITDQSAIQSGALLLFARKDDDSLYTVTKFVPGTHSRLFYKD